MANSPAFDFTAQLLIESTGIEPLAARGTVRLALKHSGLDASAVNTAQMRVVLRNVLPAELVRRGVSDASGLCARIEEQLVGANLASTSDEAERAASIFERLAPR